MCIALAITAARQGATIANHVRVTKLGKDENGKVCSVTMKDVLTGYNMGYLGSNGSFQDQ